MHTDAGGELFFYAMAFVTGSSLLLSVLRPNIFLAMVGVFSFYLIATGYRALFLKRLHEGQKPGRYDIILQSLAGVFNGGLFIWGLVHILLGQRSTAAIIFLVFGSIGSFLVWRNVQRFYKRTHDKNEWLYAHMSGFIGGYIATLSAFSVTNMEFIKPNWLQWLWPTIIGVPLIVIWTGYYKKRLSKRRRARDILEVRSK